MELKLNCYKTLWLSALFILMLDQMTKIFALNIFHIDKEYILNDYLSIHRVYNESNMMLFINFVEYFNIEVLHFRFFYVILSIIISVSIFWVLKQPAMQEKNITTELVKTGLMIIFGGLLGNLFDRIFREEGVVDFLRLNFFNNLTPIINIADIMIYIGEFCLLMGFFSIFYSKIINSKFDLLEKNN